MKALSIRQPWAWLIVRGQKSIENRNWASNYFGPLLIHAGASMSRGDYEACDIFIRGFSNIELPPYKELDRGGIVGCVDMAGCVLASDSPWFVGRVGFVFTAPKVLPFVQCKGALGFFQVPAEVLKHSALAKHFNQGGAETAAVSSGSLTRHNYSSAAGNPASPKLRPGVLSNLECGVRSAEFGENKQPTKSNQRG